MGEIVFIMPSLAGGGAERVLVTIANFLVNKGYKVVIALTIKKEIAYQLDKKIIIEYNYFNKKFYGQINFIRLILKKYKNFKIVSFLTFQNMYTIIASFGLKNEIIISERNDPSKDLSNKKYLIEIKNYLYSKADKIIFQSQGAMEYYSKSIQDKGIIISNPLKSNLPSRYLGKRKKEIVTVARLEPQKNIFLLIKAFDIFQKKYPEYILSIYGKGSLEDELKNFVYKLKLEKKVFFKGFVENVSEKIYQSSLFILSSDYEGVSNAMLEALAMGIPTISTDSSPGGARMFIKNGENGFLVPVKDEEALARTMTMIINDINLMNKISENSVKIKKILSEKEICKEWEKYLNS